MACTVKAGRLLLIIWGRTGVVCDAILAGHDRSAVWCINCTHTRRILRQSTAAGPHRRPAHLVCGVHSFAVQNAKPQLGASRGHKVSALGFAIVRKELPGGVLSYAQLGSSQLEHMHAWLLPSPSLGSHNPASALAPLALRCTMYVAFRHVF